jgi:hypothetical protein
MSHNSGGLETEVDRDCLEGSWGNFFLGGGSGMFYIMTGLLVGYMHLPKYKDWNT